MIARFFLGLLSFTLFVSFSGAAALEDRFQHPTEASKPWCYWYWLEGDITAEGITKDLENMAEIGISRAMIGNIGGGGTQTNNLSPEDEDRERVQVLSSEWEALTRHALREAKRVEVDIYMFNSPGWSQSGGPWIKPEQSMRYVTWQELEASGGAYSEHVRASGVPEGGSQDIAVLALPRLDTVSLAGKVVNDNEKPVSLADAKWIWDPAHNGKVKAPVSTCHFTSTFEADPLQLVSANIRMTADDDLTLFINDEEIFKSNKWNVVDQLSIIEYLKLGTNTIKITVSNRVESPAGLIAAMQLKDLAGEVQHIVTDQSWRVDSSASGSAGHAARELGSFNMPPWRLAEKVSPISLASSKWIWHPAQNGQIKVPTATLHFARLIQLDPSKLRSANVRITADDNFVLSINGEEVGGDGNWKTVEELSILEYLKQGTNTIELTVANLAQSPAGLIAAIQLEGLAGEVQHIVTDENWLVTGSDLDQWVSAHELGASSMAPWNLTPDAWTGTLRFTHSEPFTARSLEIHGKGQGHLYALRNGQRELVAQIDARGGNAKTDLMPDAPEMFSFEDVRAQEFEFVGRIIGYATLSSAPKVAQYIEKQLGRMHPTPSPTWESYRFPDSAEPTDASVVFDQDSVLNLSDQLGADGVLRCTLPAGDWTILYFGMKTTGKTNVPVTPEARGLEVDKMSRAHTDYHFDSYLGKLLGNMTAEERSALKGITIDSYESRAQNWTDDFAVEFEQRNGYDPLALLPVLTGRMVDSAQSSDRFLWQMRRTIADMIAENYVAGLRDAANEEDLVLWCENYGHGGFIGDFSIYGGYADEIGGEFWTTGKLGAIECRAASSSAHTYGKRRVYAEAFTSILDLEHHPYAFKAQGERFLCEGINHFVLHVYAHQPRDGMPGRNPWFGTAFHRNTPWFNQSRTWVEYLQRCHTMLQEGNPHADVAVYVGDFAPQMAGPENPVPSGYDYDLIGSDSILRKLHVVDGDWVIYDEHDAERIAARYQLLALPELKHIRPQILKRLSELREQGGAVVESVPVSSASLQAAGIAPVVSDPSFQILWKARELEDGMLFFLSNFEKTGRFEATLRVQGKEPQWYNPVSGEIKRIARYQETEEGTRITLNVKDKSDSFFIVFRDAPSVPAVVKASAPVTELELYYDSAGRLIGESQQPGRYTLTMSDGSERMLEITQGSRQFSIPDRWQSEAQDAAGFSVLKQTSFDLPRDFSQEQRVILDLGEVDVMAEVTLNGEAYGTLWMPPFELDVTDALRAGQNELSVLVTSTSQSKPKISENVSLVTQTRKMLK